MKGELPVVGGRIPHHLNDQLQAFCQQTGKTSSEVIRDALSAYLGVHSPESIESLNKRVAALERQYKKLAQLV
jgi:predicted DNA-binding protein